MNTITSLTRDDGLVVTDHNDLCNFPKPYFDNLYCGATVEIDEVINHVPLYLLFDNNSSHLASFSIDEFKNSLFFKWTQANHLGLIWPQSNLL